MRSRKSIIAGCAMVVIFWGTVVLRAEGDSMEPQTLHSENSEQAFVPGGRAFAKVYFNYHQPLNASSANPGFELTRAYLGYKYQMAERFYVKVNIDAGKAKVDVNDSVTVSSSLHYTAYMKNAYMHYGGEKLAVSLGLIGLDNFKVQENFWGHRYLYKSFQDHHKIAPSADLGLYAQYRPLKVLELDFTVRNGEGYKLIQMDDYLNYGFGVTLYPLKGLLLRGYYDFSRHGLTRSVITGFVGYKAGSFVAGAEYNHLIGEKYKEDHRLDGLSAFASYGLGKRFEVFGRFDMLSSNIIGEDTDPWNVGKDGQNSIAGVQFVPFKGLKTALNFRAWNPAAAGASTTYFLYLNFEYAFK